MSEKLKPCPFCGGEAGKTDRFNIGCDVCLYELNGLPHLIDKTWNTRSESDELSEALMLLDEACAEPEWSDAVDEFLSKIKEPPA